MVVATMSLARPARGSPSERHLPSATSGNYPARMRSLGTGWTDGIGHLGAWGGVLIAGALFSAASPRSWIVFITIPCSLLPGLMVVLFGKRQRARALQELAH
jgi:MFS transporter, putative metabolite:H+ symporter